VSDFNKLHARGHDHSVFLCAFDLLELEGEDWRSEPLQVRKKRLRKRLARSKDGIQYNDHSRMTGG
jgi:ATP-dependent DNA ligase